MLYSGQVLQGRYQLQQKLGQNAGRQTWLAVDLATPSWGDSLVPTLVIIKLLALSEEVNWNDFKLFEREVQVLKQLSHPQIPKYWDDFCIQERWLWFGIVQEYIPGSSLKELLQQGKRFTEQHVRQIATEVLHVLVYLHELNPVVIHRDIKPSNLIWGENERVYLVDFGAVQDKAAKEGATFTVVGTYGYTPIEQFGGRAVPSSDLYALGATLIHLLTGIAPVDLPQRNLQIQFTEWVSSSPRLVSWLQQLSEPALERRFTSARQALVAMGQGDKGTRGQGDKGTFWILDFGLILSPSFPSPPSSLSLAPSSIPEEIQGWNWGAFLATPFWALTHRVGIGLLAWVPIVGFWTAIALGVKGNEWAWKSRKWQSIDQFKAHQRNWAIAGLILAMSVNLVVWHVGLLLLLTSLF